MKKRILLVITVLLVFGLGVAGFAYKQTRAHGTAMSCCKGDSCPMKKKDASAGETASCCDNCDCCKGGAESCPMKAKGEKPEAVTAADMQNVTVVSSHDGCCCSCCGAKKDG